MDASVQKLYGADGLFRYNGEPLLRSKVISARPNKKEVLCGTCGRMIEKWCDHCKQAQSETVTNMEVLMKKWEVQKMDIQTENHIDDYNQKMYITRNILIDPNTFNDDMSSLTSGHRTVQSTRRKHLGPPKRIGEYRPCLEDDPEYAAAILVFNYKTERRRRWEEKWGVKPDKEYLKFFGGGKKAHAEILLDDTRHRILPSTTFTRSLEKQHGGCTQPLGRSVAQARPLYHAAGGVMQDRPHWCSSDSKTGLKVKGT